MEWSNEKCLQLIDEYEKHPILWQAKHPDHFSRNKKFDAWQSIANNLKVQEHEVKQKISSLLGSFRREKGKGVKTVGTGKGRTEVYISKWFAFERMHYLLDKDEPRNTKDTENGKMQAFENVETQNDPDTVQPEPLSINLEDSNLETIPESAHTPSSSQDNVHTQKEHFQSPVYPKSRKRKTNNKSEDPRLEDAYTILKHTIAAPAEPQDEFSAYGAYIANKLRGYTKKAQAEVQHSFNNILYEADIGRYDSHTPTAYPYYHASPHPSMYSSCSTPSPSACSTADPNSTTTHNVEYTSLNFTPHATPNQNPIPASGANQNPITNTPNPSSLGLPDIEYSFQN